MPVYPGRREGTWRVVVWSRGEPSEEVVEGGKRDALTREAALRIELEAKAIARSRGVPRFSNFCVETYTPYAKRHLEATTWASRKYQVATLIEFFGSTRLTDIDTELIEEFKTERLEKIERSSLNTELMILQAILSWARKLGKPATKPAIVFMKIKSGRVKTYTEAQVQGLYAATRVLAPDLLPLFIWLVNTGCRKGEGIAAEWSWIDLPASMIRIPVNEYWRPKDGEPREIPLSDALKAALSGPRRDPRWVFPRLTTGRWDGGRYLGFPDDRWEEIRDAAKLEGGPHRLRHTFASLFLQSVPDLFLLAKVLGHSTTKVTELYAHLLPNHLGRAKNAVSIGPETMAVTMAKGRRT